MKKMLLFVLLFLAACKQATVSQPSLNFSIILDDFSKLDGQLNTSWHEEQIPHNLIPNTAIQPWADSMLLLRNQTSDAYAILLIDARTAMLKSQLAYYLARDIGPRGELEMSKLGKEVNVTEKIDCAESSNIIKETKLYASSYKYWLSFNYYMDELLQKSQDAREKIGTDDKRPAFYNAVFDTAKEELAAIEKSMKEQCDVSVGITI